ncbi:LacI family DNA-binding transcriptional regulator [Lacticaseibacillus jixianensis]|uniref:LacI family DNA-binding transcriptional regulator n=1 Tax=Lacticaseibacillus jixianensis TaxID=2486012 RepID=A0ABW4B7J9_9LACO|nr:LacI family DNA-binding transcriptional regulator [Lacticaseibacillus jixianensis]
MAKLADVAALAGVSITTVSRVINDYGAISTKTRNKVHAAMKTLNYQPNSLARSLQGKRTKLIGLIFPGVSNPFFGDLVQSLENQLFAQDYRVILCNSANNAAKEAAYVRMLLANQVDGIITGTHNLTIKEYEEIAAPVISFDRHLGATIPIVSSDNFEGGRLATNALVKAGAQAIWIVTGANRPLSPTNERLRGYREVMTQNQLPTHLLELPFSMAAPLKWARLRQLLQEQRPEAVFATDDLTALMVEEIARGMGLSIPGDLKIVGYDGTAAVRATHPGLATIVQPIPALSKLMIELLMSRIEDEAVKLDPQYILPIELHAGTTLLGD